MAATKKAAAAAAAETESATALVPVDVADLEEDAGGGFEGADRDAFAIPFLTILQSNSPQVDPGDGDYVEGATAGKIFDTVNGTLRDEVVVVPVHYRRSFIEWVPRTSGGGLVAEHEGEEGLGLFNSASRDGSKNVLDNGNEISDTRHHYVLVLDEEGEVVEPAVIAMTSTMLKTSRRWMTSMQGLRAVARDGRKFTPPSFANAWRLRVVRQENDKGRWYAWDRPVLVGPVGAEPYRAAKEFRSAIIAGDVREEGREEATGDDVARGDENIPF